MVVVNGINTPPTDDHELVLLTRDREVPIALFHRVNSDERRQTRRQVQTFLNRRQQDRMNSLPYPAIETPIRGGLVNTLAHGPSLGLVACHPSGQSISVPPSVNESADRPSAASRAPAVQPAVIAVRAPRSARGRQRWEPLRIQLGQRGFTRLRFKKARFKLFWVRRQFFPMNIGTLIIPHRVVMHEGHGLRVVVPVAVPIPKSPKTCEDLARRWFDRDWKLLGNVNWPELDRDDPFLTDYITVQGQDIDQIFLDAEYDL